MKKIGDLLALSILGISIYILTNIINVFEKLGLFFGAMGSIFGIVTQSYVLYNKWSGGKK